MLWARGRPDGEVGRERVVIRYSSRPNKRRERRGPCVHRKSANERRIAHGCSQIHMQAHAHGYRIEYQSVTREWPTRRTRRRTR